MNSNQIKCSYCEEVFPDKIQKNLHQVLYSSDESDPCVVCEQLIPECVSREIHMSSHPSCIECKIHFKSLDFLYSHKVVHHSDAVPPELCEKKGKKYWVCYICDLCFRDPVLAEIHTSTQHFLIKYIFSNI